MRWTVAVLLIFLAVGPAVAGDVVLGPGFSQRDLAELSAVMADAMAFPQLAEAAPLGVAGFHLLLAVGGPEVSTRAGWWNQAMRDRVVGGVLLAPRAVARKGLPLRLDVGGQMGRVFGHTFWGAEAAWGVLEGGVLLPAVGLAAAYCRLEGAPLSLATGEARLTVSKGFTFITPFASVGLRRERATAFLAPPVGRSVTVEKDRVTAAGGVVIGVPPLRLVAEARRAATTAFFLGLGVGL